MAEAAVFFLPKNKKWRNTSMTIIINFLKYFISKWLGTKAIEKVLIVVLKELVKRTESKIDDRIYEAVFGKLEGEKNEQ